MTWSVFNPSVVVRDDGTIEANWFDCMVASFARHDGELAELIEEHAEILDARLELIRDMLATNTLERRETDKPTICLMELVRPFFEKKEQA